MATSMSVSHHAMMLDGTKIPPQGCVFNNALLSLFCMQMTILKLVLKDVLRLPTTSPIIKPMNVNPSAPSGHMPKFKVEPVLLIAQMSLILMLPSILQDLLVFASHIAMTLTLDQISPRNACLNALICPSRHMLNSMGGFVLKSVKDSFSEIMIQELVKQIA